MGAFAIQVVSLSEGYPDTLILKESEKNLVSELNLQMGFLASCQHLWQIQTILIK